MSDAAGSAPGRSAPGLDADAVARLGGPSWLAEQRLAAFERFEKSALPTEDEEDWRYGRIDELDLGSFGPVDGQRARRAARVTRTPAFVEELLAAIGAADGRVRCVDGFVCEIETDRESRVLEQAGVTLTSFSSFEGADRTGPPEGLGEAIAARADALTALAEAFSGDGVVLDVPAGVRIERPIVIVHELTAPGLEDGERAPASFPRTLVHLGAGAAAAVVEIFVSGGDRRLAVPLTELELGEGAQLAYQSVQLLGASTWQLAYQSSRLARDAKLVSFAAALGGDYCRLATQSALVGEGAESHLFAVYLGDDAQVQDLRTFQDHLAPRTSSELVYKGAVGGTARSVYTGLIHMRRGARRSVASQSNRNLVLSEGAHADSVPNLDIEENDVRCSHASAVGPIDAEQRFYVESRGVPPEIAERLILVGFFDDLLTRAPIPGVASWLRGDVAHRLGDALSAPDAIPAADSTPADLGVGARKGDLDDA